MNAPIRHQQIRLDPLTVFKARAEARAILWAAREIDLHEAVDALQAAAETSGLVEKIGQDTVQAILHDAFHRVRTAEGKPRPWGGLIWAGPRPRVSITPPGHQYRTPRTRSLCEPEHEPDACSNPTSHSSEHGTRCRDSVCGPNPQ